MFKHKFALSAVLAAATLALAGQAMATTLGYTPSTSMPVLPYQGLVFDINKINNGDTSTLDGFASTQATGTIRLDLKECGAIRTFTLYNNINGTTNGVKAFTLTYYGGNGTVLGTQSVTVNNAAAPQAIIPPSGPLMQFVKRIDMKITASFDRQVEIREIVLDGKPGSCCP